MWMPWQARQMLAACYAHRSGRLLTLTLVARAMGALEDGGVDRMARELATMKVKLPASLVVPR